MNDNQRFFDRVEKTATCWNWVGGMSNKGYGRFWFQGNQIMAHHFLLLDTKPNGAWVLHHCDNPSCVRPDHLFFGDAKANSQDMHRKGRGNPLPGWKAMFAARIYDVGEKCYAAKLTEKKVLWIRNQPKHFGYMSKMARKFGVTHDAIRQVIQRKTWMHI